MKKTVSFTSISLIIFGAIAVLAYFQENIILGLINPLKDIFLNIFSLFPLVLFFLGCIYLIGALIDKKGRAEKILLGIICLLFGLYLGNPGGIEGMFSFIIFGRDTPRGWR